MGFNPLKEKGIPLEKQTVSWSKANVQPYNKNEIGKIPCSIGCP
ncbi:hypothetical protein [Desulfopila inferna]|nr:hypothetical protein [Desulfopila inferna]